jgi:chemotaxis protein MotB
MAGPANGAPVIIKRKTTIVDGGHSGGAWKIAYADFATAMMAFFMLMWLISATTEEQRKGIADYFNPTLFVTQSALGGDGVIKGYSLRKHETADPLGNGQAKPVPEKRDGPTDQKADLKRLQSLLEGRGGESQTMQRLLSHVVTQVSDEGLVIEVFDTSANPLFDTDTDVPTQTLTALSDLLADVMAMTTNKIAVEGYVRAYPVTLIKNPSWDLSTARAQALRQLLQQSGLDQGRIARVSGHADRTPVTANPMAGRNNRIKVILLRSDR